MHSFRRVACAWILAALAMLTVWPAAAQVQQPVLAVVETDKELAPLADLLMAQLSQEGVQLVERKQLDAILQEQELSAAGLTERVNLVKVGRLVRADAFVLLSVEKGKDASLLRVRVAETAHGVRLLDALTAWDAQQALEAAGALAGSLKGVVDKLRLPAGQVMAVSIMRVNAGPDLPPEDKWLPEGLRGALSARLAAEPRVVVLEREDLDLLRQEKDLTAGEHGAFLGAAVLIDAFVGASPNKELVLTVELLDADGKSRGTTEVPVSADDPLAAVQAAAEKLVPRLTHAAAAGTLAGEAEAQQFYKRAGLFVGSVQNPDETMSLLATAHALAPQNARYGIGMHRFALTQSIEAGDPAAGQAALSTGCSRITSSRMSQTSGRSFSTMRCAALMVLARP